MHWLAIWLGPSTRSLHKIYEIDYEWSVLTGVSFAGVWVRGYHCTTLCSCAHVAATCWKVNVCVSAQLVGTYVLVFVVGAFGGLFCLLTASALAFARGGV